MSPVIVALFLAAVVAGCSYEGTGYPKNPITDFVADDPLLAELILEAAQELTDAGVVIAGRITVNVNPKGLKVKWQRPEESATNCLGEETLKEGQYIRGCIPAQNGKFNHTMWITLTEPKEEVAASADLRRFYKYGVMHEMLHVLLPTPWHIAHDTPGVFNSQGSEGLTQADLDFIAQFTEVLDVGWNVRT